MAYLIERKANGIGEALKNGGHPLDAANVLLLSDDEVNTVHEAMQLFYDTGDNEIPGQEMWASARHILLVLNEEV